MQISMEGLLTFVNYFELMAFLGFNPMAGTAMKMIQIKHILKVNEFKLIRKSVFHSIFRAGRNCEMNRKLSGSMSAMAERSEAIL